MAEHRRLAAILVADVVGYSRLIGSGEAQTLAQLQALRTDVIEPSIAIHAGRLFKSVGDGFLVEFASAVQAVTCAKAIQEANRAGPLALRIGIHVGDVVVQGDDLMGDGVNVAARLEAVAEPGGIALSRQVHDQVRDKLDLPFTDKGEVELKNIARPVEVFIVGGAHPSAQPPGLPLPDKPSIAVLPFQNMGGDPEQENFVDGLVEDIITALSRFRQLFVIARNSTFTYKGKAVDIRQVARELGVRYVLEGSVRRAANRIRVTGQLIEAMNGSHLWAERYDRALEDVFVVQEELTLSIVAALVPQIDAAEFARLTRRRPVNLGAQELTYRAFAEAMEAYNKTDAALCDSAIATAKRAVAIDPGNSQAWTVICFALNMHLLAGRAADLDRVRSEALAAGTRAIEADPLNSGAFTARGTYQCNNLRFADGLRDLHRACDLNPNDATALFVLGYFQAMSGDASSGIELIERAIRLSPKDIWRPMMHQNLAFAHAVGRTYAAGVEAAMVSLSEAPAMAPTYSTLALNYVGLGEVDKARATVEKLRHVAPSHLDMRLRSGWPLSQPEDRERLHTFIRIAAGLQDPAAAESMR